MSFKYDEKLDLYSWNSQTIIIEKIKPNSSVLEFGCANGRLTKHLSKEKGCKLTIVEIDEESGKEASKYATECFLGNERGNIEKYYWSEINQKFDYIVFADVLEHLYSPDKVLEQCKKVLKEDGLILISIPNVANYSIINQLLKGEFNYTEVGLLDNTHLRFFTKKTFKNMIEKIGYFVESIVALQAYVKKTNEVTLIDNICKVSSESQTYQYIFSISLSNIKDSFEEVLDNRLQHSYYFSNIIDDFEISEANRDKYKLTDHKVSLNIESQTSSFFLRFDPIETNCIIRLGKVFIPTILGNKEIKLVGNNSDFNDNGIYFFSSEDPQFIFEVENIYDEKEIIIEFELLNYDLQNYIKCLFPYLKTEIEKNLSLSYELDSRIKWYEEQIILKEKYIKSYEEDFKNKIKWYEDQIHLKDEKIKWYEKHIELKDECIENYKDEVSDKIRKYEKQIELKDIEINEKNYKLEKLYNNFILKFFIKDKN